MCIRDSPQTVAVYVRGRFRLRFPRVISVAGGQRNQATEIHIHPEYRML